MNGPHTREPSSIRPIGTVGLTELTLLIADKELIDGGCPLDRLLYRRRDQNLVNVPFWFALDLTLN